MKLALIWRASWRWPLRRSKRRATCRIAPRSKRPSTTPRPRPPRRPTTPRRSIGWRWPRPTWPKSPSNSTTRKRSPGRRTRHPGSRKGRLAQTRHRRVLPRAGHALRPGGHRHHERPELRRQGQGRHQQGRGEGAEFVRRVRSARRRQLLPARATGRRPQPAIPDFQKAIQLDPKNAEAYLWLGISLRARTATPKRARRSPSRWS